MKEFRYLYVNLSWGGVVRSVPELVTGASRARDMGAWCGDWGSMAVAWVVKKVLEFFFSFDSVSFGGNP